MAHFTNVTKEEMEEFLFPQGFKLLKLPNTTELVYGKRVDSHGRQITLRIFTGINPNGQSRACGEDAMRTTLFWRDEEGTVRMCGGSKRVHRVEGWRKNLQNRIDRLDELMGPDCPVCNKLMVERRGSKGLFFGCSGYPSCTKTLPIK